MKSGWVIELEKVYKAKRQRVKKIKGFLDSEPNLGVSISDVEYETWLDELERELEAKKEKRVEVPENRTRKKYERYTQEQIINEIKTSNNILEVANNLGCTRQTIYCYIRNYPAIKAAHEEAKKKGFRLQWGTSKAEVGVKKQEIPLYESVKARLIREQKESMVVETDTGGCKICKGTTIMRKYHKERSPTPPGFMIRITTVVDCPSCGIGVADAIATV